MRLLSVQHASDLGGSFVSHYQMIKCLLDLRNMHHDLSVVVVCKYKHMVSYYKKLGVNEVYYFPWIIQIGHCTGLEYNLRSLKDIILLFKHIIFFIPSSLLQYFFFLNLSVDKVHVNSSTLLSSVLAGFMMRKKVTIHIREMIRPGNWGIRKKILIALLKRWGHDFIFISPVETLYFSSIPEDKKNIIYNPLGRLQEEFNDGPLEIISENDYFKIVCLGGNVPLKETLTLLKAIAFNTQLRKIELFILGKINNIEENRNKKKKTYEDWINHYVNILQERGHLVSLIGEQEEVGKYLKNGHLLFSATKKIHFSRPIFEAFYMGRPVLTYHNMEPYGLKDEINCFMSPENFIDLGYTIQKIQNLYLNRDIHLQNVISHAKFLSSKMDNINFEKNIKKILMSDLYS